jgi:cytochrome P450
MNTTAQNLTKSFFGGSILFSDSNENWRSRRRAMTPAFYKERLRGLVKLAANTIKNSIKRMKVDKERTFDIMEEILKTASEVILSCSMGEDSSTWEIDCWENGKCTKRDAAFVFRHTTARYMERAVMPHILMFPSLLHVNIFPFERENEKNAVSCRECVR